MKPRPTRRARTRPSCRAAPGIPGQRRANQYEHRPADPDTGRPGTGPRTQSARGPASPFARGLLFGLLLTLPLWAVAVVVAVLLL